MQEFQLHTPKEGFIDITAQIAAVVQASRMKDGICQVFIPHTTAGVTINENADPDVVADMLKALNHMVPELNYQHGEGNSRAHVKSSLLGCSLSIPFADAKLSLGTWQGVYFCEFDGPRKRKYRVQIIGQ